MGGQLTAGESFSSLKTLNARLYSWDDIRGCSYPKPDPPHHHNYDRLIFFFQQLNDNRRRPDKRTEFYEHTTKGKKANYDFYEYAGASSKRRSKRRKVFLAVTSRGQFILVEHPYKKVENPGKSQNPKYFKKGEKVTRVSYKWNKGVAWTGRSKPKKTRETRRKDRKQHDEMKKTRKRDKSKSQIKYSLYFMSTPAHEDYIKQAFEKTKPRRSRKKQWNTKNEVDQQVHQLNCYILRKLTINKMRADITTKN